MYFNINYYFSYGIKRQKMVKKSWSLFPKSQCDVFKCPDQPKNIHFIIKLLKKPEKKFTMKKLNMQINMEIK